MQHWEYKIVYVTARSSFGGGRVSGTILVGGEESQLSVSEIMEHLGREGWELVAATSANFEVTRYDTLYFKRPVARA